MEIAPVSSRRRRLQPQDADPGPSDPSDLDDLRRTESIVVVARWVGVALGLLQVTIYASVPYPPGVQEAGYGLVAILAGGNVALWVANRRVETVGSARRLNAIAQAFDVAIAMGFVWLYTFDPTSSLFTVLFIVTAAGALRFQFAGAVLSWVLVTVLYVAREVFGQWAYGTPLMIDSITFRMGILLVVSLMMGMMAQKLWRQQQNLAVALRELQRVDGWRSGLVNVLAHDLRSPLSGVVNTLDLVAQHREKLGQQQVDELLAMASRSTRRTLRLADDLLDLARLEQGRLELRPQLVRVRQAVETAIEILPERDRIELRIDHELEALVDGARLEQIVLNLVGNALKHGRPPVIVSAVVAEATLTLSVQDHGDGVRAEDRAGLFQAFAQGPRSDSVGLGLWIVAQLAEAHGGRAYFDEHSADGTTFVVQLRELTAGPTEAEPPPQVTSGSSA